MELACDIIIKKNYESNTEKYQKKFIDLKLNKKILSLKPAEYLNEINKKKNLKCVNDFVDKLFKKHDDKLGYSLMLSYYISYNAEELFKPFKTNSDLNFLNAANKIIYYLEKIKDDMNIIYQDDFIDAVDEYFAYYKKWTSKDTLYHIDSLFENLTKLITIYKIKIKKQMEIKNEINEIMEIMDKIYKIDKKFAIKTFLNKYQYFVINEILTNKIWHMIEKMSFNENDRNHIILLIIAELRVKLIPMLVIPKDRKDIYYQIDTEEIIKNIRCNNFHLTNLKKIMDIFEDKISILYPKYKNINDTTMSIKWNENIIFEKFKMMFNVLQFIEY